MAKGSQGETASEQQNMALLRRYQQAWNDRDLKAFVACTADELQVRTGEGPDDFVTVDHDRHAAVAQTFFDAFDVKVEEREMLASSDRVFVRWRYLCRHIGEWTIDGEGFPPTGKEFSFDAWQVFRVEGGLICEERSLVDRLRWYKEIGALP